jgi:large subunit ribosomal protein L29
MAKEKLALTNLSIDDLNEKLGALQSELSGMKFDHAVKGLGNPMQLRAMRRDIARIYTEIRQRELGVMEPEQLALRSKIRARRRRQK